jgi:hypothetical protein
MATLRVDGRVGTALSGVLQEGIFEDEIDLMLDNLDAVEELARFEKRHGDSMRGEGSGNFHWGTQPLLRRWLW